MAASVDNRQAFGLLPSSPLHQSSQTLQIVLDHSFCSSSDDDDDDGRMDWWIKSLESEPCARDPRDEGTADSWIPRNPSLIRLTGKHPFNAEPSLAHLMRHGFITPTPIHYVRNHGAVPRADWSTWTVQVSGLVRRPVAFTMDDLVTRFPAVDIPVTLVCAGNRRKEQNMSRQTVGFNWGPSAVSTSVWRGALLRDVLRRCGVMRRGNGALNVCFEGAEELPGGGGSRYGTSLRKEVAMDPSRDIMLAYMQNGEVLSPDHGFPVRMIIPGFIGGRMVKWLRRIVVTTQESDSYYHYKDNRVLPSHVDAELADAEGWWYKPEYIINELNINSVITTPDHDELLPINTLTTQTPYTVRGYAYSGGGKKVTRVEITLDGGETWRVCSLDHPEKPNKYGKYWCWCFWSLPVELLHLLAAKEMAVRAWDETLSTQPHKLIWNVMGMMNNCWFRVKIAVCRPHGGEVSLAFHHPTQPGNQPGGWMNRLESSAATSSLPSLKKSVSAPIMNTSPNLSLSEVRTHASADSAWIVIHGHVYDCTAFLKDHPGGADSILINAGTDCTEEFDAIHSDKAKSMLDAYRIGELVAAGDTSSSPRLATIMEGAALTNPREKVLVKLVGKTLISRDVRLLRFALPSANQVLGLPVGKHVFLCATIGSKLCMRAYTPTSPAEAVGYFELLIRVYFKGEHPKFPSGGLMSQHLESLPVGAAMEIKGPVGHIEYAGQGKFIIGGKSRCAKRLAMVAGGTGITPVYQVIQAVMREQPGEDCTEMQLVYASRSEEDILLREELDRWARERPEQLKVWYVVSEVRRREEWRYSVGRVTEGILGEHIPMRGEEETLALVCGPPEMIQKAVLPILEKMKYVVNDSCLLF